MPAILQIVSTNEALLDRRLAEIPTSEWGDLSIDITPREYVLDYLSHSFPTQLFELYSDDEGNLQSRPAYDADGNPVISREAVERRDRMIEHLASLPPVQGALDQILHRFGTDLVAEVTGRSRRIVRRGDRLCVETRPASANFAETAAFMDDDKRILVFSDAGGTGRSYHADLACRNQRRRIHYLLGAGLARRCRDPGSRPLQPHQPEAAAGVSARRDRRQGREALPVDDRAPSRHLGRDHPRPAPDRRPGPVPRRRQSRKPLRQGGAAPVLPAALCREDRGLLARPTFRTRPVSISSTRTARLREELPPITQFLNRILALRIDLQNTLFAAFEQLLDARIEAALAAGTYDVGVETLTAESFRVAERRTVYTHAATGAETRCYRVLRKDRNRPLPLAEALDAHAAPAAVC